MRWMNNIKYISDDSKDSFLLQNFSLNTFPFHPFGGETSRDNILPIPEYFKEEDNEFNFDPIGEDVSSDIILPVPEYSNENNEFSFRPIREDISSDDILHVSEYSKEICEYLKSREVPTMAVCDYMMSQPDVTFSMRATLVDWLVEVAEEYKLNTGTIYLAVSYIDRFLSQMAVERSKLQLVGTASMLIAAKFEEIYPPALKVFVFITDNSYTKQEVLQMEQLVLQVLDFDVSPPTSHQFLTHYCRMLDMDDKVLHLALYHNELGLLDGGTFLKFSPSLQAAGSVVLARHTLGLEAWSDATAAKMCLRTFLLLVVVRLVWMKATKTGFVDDSEPSLQYLDPSPPVTSLDVMESSINTLDEELNDITSKMKEHTLEAMSDTRTETTEVIAEAIRNNEKLNKLLEPSEEKMDDKIEDILYVSEATNEVKQIPEMIVTPQSSVNNKKISNLTELTGEQSKEKKDDAVDVTNVKNEKLSFEAVTEKIDNEKASNPIELLNEKENIMDLSKVNDEDELTSKEEITETNNAIGMTIEEKMEKKSVEFLQELSEENNEDFKGNVQLQSEVDDPSTIMDTIISEEMSSTSSALDGSKLTVNSSERIDEMEEDTKFIDEIKEKINFLEESMNKHANKLNLHLVDLEHIEYAHVKMESESKAEDWTLSKNSIEVPLRVETFGDIVGEFIQDQVRIPSEDFGNVGNPIKVKNYKEENNVGNQKYSLHPKEGIDLWFPIHEEDLDHVEDSEQITQTENVETAQDDTPNEKTDEELTQTPDDKLVYKETNINPNVKLLLKRTGFWKDNKEVKHEERSFWLIAVVGLMMLIVLLLAVLMGINFLSKTDKKPMIFTKSLNLWGNDYAPLEISSIKKPKYNKIK